MEKNIPVPGESDASVSSEASADAGQIEDNHPVSEKPDRETYLSPEYWREYYLFTVDYGYPDEYSHESGDIDVRRMFYNISCLLCVMCCSIHLSKPSRQRESLIK